MVGHVAGVEGHRLARGGLGLGILALIVKDPRVGVVREFIVRTQADGLPAGGQGIIAPVQGREANSQHRVCVRVVGMFGEVHLQLLGRLVEAAELHQLLSPCEVCRHRPAILGVVGKPPGFDLRQSPPGRVEFHRRISENTAASLSLPVELWLGLGPTVGFSDNA